MLNRKISTEVAYRLRFERGLFLPTDREYEVEELATIAKRQQELMDEMIKLDERILELMPGV